MDPIDISYYPKTYSIFQLISVPAAFINFLGLYVIWFGTPKRIGNYKNYMCYLQINAILYDIILIYLIFPICAIPAGGCFSMGVLPKFGITAWVQMSLGFGIMTSFLAAIAIAFFSRQQAILDEGHRLKFSKRTGKLICILIALHPLYYVVPAGLCILMLNDEQQAHAYHYVTHPIVKNFISQPSYYALEAKMRFITVPAASIYNSVVFYGFIYLIVPSYLQIQSFKVATTSRKTLKMQQRWLNSLLVQTATFYFIYMFPAFWYAIIYYYGWYYLAAYSIWLTILSCSHGIASTIVLFIFYGSYRKFLYQWILQITVAIRGRDQERTSSIFVVQPSRVVLEMNLRVTREK